METTLRLLSNPRKKEKTIQLELTFPGDIETAEGLLGIDFYEDLQSRIARYLVELGDLKKAKK